MKRDLIFLFVLLLMLACGAKKDTQPPSKPVTTQKVEPTFTSPRFGVSFPSKLSKELRIQGESFARIQLDSVVLISLLPDCKIQEGKQRCYETTVLSTPDGDSINVEMRNDLGQIKINQDRFGLVKSLKPDDLKKLLSPLFAGHDKEAISFCYVPRHAIAIFGPDKQMTGFIEICFECSESMVILQGLEIPPLSQKSLNGLGSLFLDHGYDENKLHSEFP